MTATTGIQQQQVANKTIVSNSMESQPEVIGATIAFCGEFARQAGANIGLNIAASIKELVLSQLAPEAVQILSAGQAIQFESGLTLQIIEDQHLKSFVGLILFVGVDETRLNLLKADRIAMVIAVPQTDEDRTSLLNAFPNAGILNYQPEPERTPLSESQEARTKWFEERYHVLTQGFLHPNSERVYLGEGEPQVCRYCGKSAQEVSFSNISHAFPEQIGNKRLIDKRECDICNAHFAVMIDDPFSKWSLPARSTGRIRGKKKAPSLVTSDSAVRIDSQKGNLTVRVQNGDDRIKFDSEGKSIAMSLERQPYVPMGVFKCLVKMALAVMPEPEASRCQHLKSWILAKTHTYESLPYSPLMLYSQLISGPIPNDKITYMLLRRKDSAIDCPYFVFVVQYGNHVHQIFLPMPEQDNRGSKEAKLNLMYFSHPWDTPEHVAKYGPAKLVPEDLTSPEIKRGDHYPIRFSFDSVQETTPPKTN